MTAKSVANREPRKRVVPAAANNTETPSTNQQARFSTMNQYVGVVTSVTEGEVSVVVSLDIGCGNKITSIFTKQELADLGIQIGSTVTVIIDPASVVLYVYGE